MAVQVQVRVERHTRTLVASRCELQQQLISYRSGVCIQMQALAQGVDEAIIEASRIAAANVVQFPVQKYVTNSFPMPC